MYEFKLFWYYSYSLYHLCLWLKLFRVTEWRASHSLRQMQSVKIKPITQLPNLLLLFPKQKDFLNLILSIHYSHIRRCKIAFYANDSQLSNRRASFGYGNKSDFTKTLTASPSVTTYRHKSVFTDNKNKGKTFGNTRDGSPDRSYLVPQLHKVPGPGQVSYCLYL